MSEENLLEYLRTHPPQPFRPVPHHNRDAHLVEWYWSEERAYAYPVYVSGKHVGSVLRSIETNEPVGVKVNLEAAGICQTPTLGE